MKNITDERIEFENTFDDLTEPCITDISLAKHCKDGIIINFEKYSNYLDAYLDTSTIVQSSKLVNEFYKVLENPSLENKQSLKDALFFEIDWEEVSLTLEDEENACLQELYPNFEYNNEEYNWNKYEDCYEIIDDGRIIDYSKVDFSYEEPPEGAIFKGKQSSAEIEI